MSVSFIDFSQELLWCARRHSIKSQSKTWNGYREVRVIQNILKSTSKTHIKVDSIPTLLRRLTPTLCACTEPAIVTHGTPMYKDSHVVVVPAYGKVSKLQKKEQFTKGNKTIHSTYTNSVLIIVIKILVNPQTWLTTRLKST
jgi:hypothetical protein